MKVALPIVKARRESLSQLLRLHRYMPVPEICKRLGISEATARRDLTVLTKEQKITRTHGGALGDFNATFASFRSRKYRARKAKEQIAKIAVSKIHAGSTCFFDAGTTLLAIAERLVSVPVFPLTIVTSNVPVAEVLSVIEGVDVFLLGGQFLNRQGALFGAKAMDALRQWSFDAAFLGGEGMTSEGIWNSHADIVKLQRAIFNRTKKAYFCIDGGKYGHNTSHFLMGWNEGLHLITDIPPKGIRMGAKHLISAN